MTCFAETKKGRLRPPFPFSSHAIKLQSVFPVCPGSSLVIPLLSPRLLRHESLSYIAAWLLALLPLGLLLYVYRFHRVCSAVLGRSMTWLAYGCALFPAVALTFTINDFGRTISYSCLMFLFFVLHILRIYRDADGDLPVRPCFTKLHFANTPVLIGSLYYLLCWKLYHYVPLSMEPRIISLSF